MKKNKFYTLLITLVIASLLAGCGTVDAADIDSACNGKVPGTEVTLGNGFLGIGDTKVTCDGVGWMPPLWSIAACEALDAPESVEIEDMDVPCATVLEHSGITTLIELKPEEPAGLAGPCEDGKLVLSYNADAGQILDRTPLGEAERVDILEISYEGEGLGFGNHARAIIVIPRLGPVWMVDAVAGADTIATRGFCGTNEEVAAWAVTAHIPSLQQASRDENGNQPPAEEIAVYRLDFEARTMYVVKAATAANAPSPETVLSWIQVMFNENGAISSVPMHVVNP